MKITLLKAGKRAGHIRPPHTTKRWHPLSLLLPGGPMINDKAKDEPEMGILRETIFWDGLSDSEQRSLGHTRTRLKPFMSSRRACCLLAAVSNSSVAAVA